MPSVAEIPSTPEAQALRAAHQVRPVTEAEQGSGVDSLPPGVYGFTYSPGLPNAPLFLERRYRTFETHKIGTGVVLVLGYATPEDARRLAESGEDVTVRLRPHPDEGHATLVTIPYSRIRRHRQYAAPNQEGFTVTVGPA